MTEPSGHCPYLGLKQNRAIRFASPTTEHRCYANGDPIEIPVDQSSFCLSQGHIHCPLYMGLTVPTTNDTIVLPTERGAVAQSGLRSWFASLPPRDRAVYALMIGLLTLIVAVYLFAGLQSFFGPRNDVAFQPTQLPTAATSAIAPTTPAAPATAAPTNALPTPTALPTAAPTAAPTIEPTEVPLIFPPTQPAQTPADSTPAPEPTSAATSAPTSAATAAPIAPTIAATNAPTAPPVRSEAVTLYFGDKTGELLVPIQRTISVQGNQLATAVVEALLAGPRSDLQALLDPGASLREARIENGTATVDFSQAPDVTGSNRGLMSVVLSLTHLPGIQRVQFQVNGQNIGIDGSGPVARPVLNELNPDGLAANTRETEFLPLYFPTQDGAYDVRLMRLVPKTTETARETIDALLDGPGSYTSAVQRVIPEGTQLRSLTLDPQSRIVTVDFSQQFAAATARESAVRNVVQSLTTLPNITGVQFLVEGRSLAEQWGEEYRNGFGRPVINQE